MHIVHLPQPFFVDFAMKKKELRGFIFRQNDCLFYGLLRKVFMLTLETEIILEACK